MAAVLAPRGPDGDGSWAEDGVALAHRRLTIIDLSDSGAQPMVDEELGLVIVFNGCIYNYKELRAELEGHGYAFFSTSDTEVMLKAFHRWGPDFVTRLKGMFAFALVDRESQRVMLARDRLGIKPLYLADFPGEMMRFASTPQALLAGGGIDTRVDAEALHHYMSWHAVVPAPKTILSGIQKLLPATYVIVDPDGNSVQTRYWWPEFSRDSERASWEPNGWRVAIEAALRDAVERRMVADVPVGVLLSGGLDSSLIVALLAEAGQRDLKTFSIGFEDVGGREGDEFQYSDIVAKQFGTDHQRIHISNDRMLPSLGNAIRAMSEPMTSHDVVAFYLLCEEVRHQVKVVQTGQGADEVFAGYHWYETVAEAGGTGLFSYVDAVFDRSQQEMEQAVSGDYLPHGDPSRRFVDLHFNRGGADEAVDRALRMDIEVSLIEDPVKRLDNMSMAWGLEARVPFLDHDLLELAIATPPELRLAQGGKGILKDIARRLLPADVVDRPKGYFPVPALSHVEGEYLEMLREALLSDAARDRGLFRPDYVRSHIDAPNEDLTPLDGNKLWQMGLLELWLQETL
jgi:asparagine synthase (glutamine-hydrolysing)